MLHPRYLCNMCFMFQSFPLICYQSVGLLNPRSLNCSMTFFPTYCVFQELGTKMTIGTERRECDRLYYLDLNFKLVACSSFVSSSDQHCQLGHPSL